MTSTYDSWKSDAPAGDSEPLWGDDEPSELSDSDEMLAEALRLEEASDEHWAFFFGPGGS